MMTILISSSWYCFSLLSCNLPSKPTTSKSISPYFSRGCPLYQKCQMLLNLAAPVVKIQRSGLLTVVAVLCPLHINRPEDMPRPCDGRRMCWVICWRLCWGDNKHNQKERCYGQRSCWFSKISWAVQSVGSSQSTCTCSISFSLLGDAV